MKIVGLDYPCMDLNLLCDHMPRKGELVCMDDMSLQGGGKVPNALIAAARLGSQCAMIGAAGDDRYGRLCRDELAEHGVDVSGLKLLPGHTSLCVSIVAGGEKHYIESPAGHPFLNPSEVDEAQIAGSQYLMLYRMDEAAIAAAEYARKHGVKVVIDADEYDEKIMEYLQLIDILIASEYFYRALYPNDNYEENLRDLHGKGIELALVTLGEEGSVGFYNGEFFKAEAWKVDQVVDTTGAGDVFHGAFCHYLGHGLAPKDAAKMAGAVSAVKCRVFGGRAGIPDAAIVEQFCKNGIVDMLPLSLRAAAYRDAAWK